MYRSMDTLELPVIPTEYQRLKVTKAYEIMGIPRATFYRKYLDTGKISISVDGEEKKYIDFSELYRVFGERATQALMRHLNNDPKDKIGESESLGNDNRDSREYIETVVKNAQLEGEISKLKALLTEKEERLREKDTIIQEQKSRIHGLEVRYDRLLEDKQAKTKPSGFVERLKSVFFS